LPSRTRRPLPLPRLSRDVARHSGVVYAMSTVDKAGRIADRSVIRALGWPPGIQLTICEQAGSLVAVPADGGTCRVDRQGHMILPLAARRWCHLTAGDPLLIAADPACSRLVGYPVAVLDRLLGAVLPNGGEPT
jgi:hypothetical protein